MVLERAVSRDNLPAAASSLEIALNSIQDHAILRLDIEGHILAWNTGAEKLKGYDEAEMLGRHFSLFYPAEDVATEMPQRCLAEARAEGKFTGQGWRVRKNGERFRADIVIHPVHTEAGELTGFVEVVRDVTLQHQLEALREEYHQAHKQEMIGQLTGGVAHDFNNLLTVIEAGHQLVGKYTADSRIARVLEVNKVAIDKSRKLISQLLAFSRKQILKPVATDINATVSVFDVLIEKAVGGNRSVQWHLAPDLPRTYIDSAQLQSALLNLVVNARDAMPLRGTIKIFTEAKYLTAQNFPAPYDVPEGLYVVLGVSDTGIGMEAPVAARAIEPFFTTKDVGQGTGLGLSQCFGFARQSGGTLVIDSVQGAGTTVRIFLPALTSDEKSERVSKLRTILLVDDDYAIRSLVGEMLRGLGHTVFEAEDARDALNQLNDNLSIDYLFTDIIMPNGINGLELVEEARSIRPGLPALLASGYPRDVLRGIAELKDDVLFLQKPYTLDKLAAQIKAAEPYPR
jgi:PAS domain S-box-containing protein